MTTRKSKNILAPAGKSAREYLQLSGDPARFARYREAAGRACARSVQSWIMDRCDRAVLLADPVDAALHHVETTRAPQ
jgi:hypothetical protein